MIQRTGIALLVIGLAGCGPNHEEYIDEIIGTDLGIVDLEYDVVSYRFDRYEEGHGGVTLFEIKADRVITEMVDLCGDMHEFTESGNLSVAGCAIKTGGGEVIDLVYTASDSTLSVAKQELD